MAFQSQVNLYTAEGVAGDLATPDQAVYTPQNFLAGSGGVNVGEFVFADSTHADTIAKKTGSGQPLGIVQRVINYADYTVTDAGTMALPEGAALTIIVKGDVWLKAPSAAAVGKKVFVNNNTGAITVNTAGTSVSNSTETSWVVKTPAAAANDMIIISNW